MGVTAKRSARIELVAGTAGVDQGLADTRRKLRTFEREQARSAKQVERNAKAQDKAKAKAMNSVRGGISSGIGMAAGMLGMDSISSALDEARDFQRNLDRFQILAGKSPEEMNALRTSILDVSKATGIASDEILAGGARYVDLSSDVAGAGKAMATFARVAQATGSSVSDIATAGASMKDAMNLDPAQFEAVFSGLAAQGKAGAIGFKDMAGSVTELLPMFKRFKGAIGADGVLQFGAAFQVAKKNFGSAETAATGLESLMGSLAQHADKFEAAGVKIFDVSKNGTKTFRNLHDIVTAIGKSSLAKDPKLLSRAFGRKEAEATFDALQGHVELYDQLIEAGKDVGTVNRDLATFMESASGKIDAAWNNIKVSIAEALTPERIQAFGNAILDLSEKIGPLVEAFAKINDFTLGGAFNVGKKIRGALSGGNAQNNPWGNALDAAHDHDIVNNDGKWIKTGEGPAAKWVERDSDAGRGQVTAARLRMQNRASYDSTVSSIMGQEKGDRTSKESIGAAAFASYSDNIGSSRAASRYLVAAGVGDDKTGQIDRAAVEEIVRSALKATGDEFNKNARTLQAALVDVIGSIGVKIGSEPIQKANANAMSHRKMQ